MSLFSSAEAASVVMAMRAQLEGKGKGFPIRAVIGLFVALSVLAFFLSNSSVSSVATCYCLRFALRNMEICLQLMFEFLYIGNYVRLTVRSFKFCSSQSDAV